MLRKGITEGAPEFIRTNPDVIEAYLGNVLLTPLLDKVRLAGD
ncbi:hypothetical protein [Marinobacter sp.]